MTTRSGRGYKRQEMDETATIAGTGEPIATEHVEDGVERTGETSPITGVPTPGTDIAALMQLVIEDRRRREAEIAKERVRRERDVEQLVSEIKEQMEAMVRLVERTTKGKTNSGEALVKVAKLTDADDIEGYLLTFERQMAAYEIDKSRWPFILAPQLTGRAQKAYMALANDEANDYSSIKQAILKRYDINEETHRWKFRAQSRKKGESYAELATSLLDLANRWLDDCISTTDLLEKVAMEQFLSKAPEDVRVWVREQKPKTCAEAGQWADEFQLARNDASRPPTDPQRQGPRRCHTCQQIGHFSHNCPKTPRNYGAATQPHHDSLPLRRPPQPHQPPSRPQPPTTNRQVRCYSCGQAGHIALHCRNNAMFCDDSENAFLAEVGERVVRQGLVEGVPVEILLDTGSARTLVRKELVPEGKVLGGTMVGVRCAHGEVVHYPIATLEVAVGGKKIAIRAGVSDRLPVQLLLGRDVPELFSLLAATSDSHSVDSVSAKQDVVAVITRAQARCGNVEQVVEDDTSEVGGDESTDFNPGREFADDLFEGGREKIQLTSLLSVGSSTSAVVIGARRARVV